MKIEKYKKGIIAGNFDVIHPGYIKMFKECKSYCKDFTLKISIPVSNFSFDTSCTFRCQAKISPPPPPSTQHPPEGSCYPPWPPHLPTPPPR